MNKHIQPEGAALDRLHIQVVGAGHDTIFPKARVVRDRFASEQVPTAAPEVQHKRVYSRDCGLPTKSRFAFVEEAADEEAPQLPEYVNELLSLATPSEPSAELGSQHLGELISPCSPDKWALDVFEIRPRSFSDASLLTTGRLAALRSDELFLVIPKQSE